MKHKRSEQVLHFPTASPLLRPTRMATPRERAGLIHPNEKIGEVFMPENPKFEHECDDCMCECHEENEVESPLDPLSNDYRDEEG